MFSEQTNTSIEEVSKKTKSSTDKTGQSGQNRTPKIDYSINPSYFSTLKIERMTVEKYIQERLSIPSKSIENTLQLLAEDCTIPFIARYRKDKTGNLDEVAIENKF